MIQQQWRGEISGPTGFSRGALCVSHPKGADFTRPLCLFWEKAGELEKAEACYLRGLDLNPAAEALVQRLMMLYQKQGRQFEAMGVYHRCRRVLLTTLEVKPSDETQRIYRSL